MKEERDKEYIKDLKRQVKRAKNIIIENPKEIVERMIGLEMWEFEVLSAGSDLDEEAYCAKEEIYISFQGKEMRIYINEDGKLCVYTD